MTKSHRKESQYSNRKKTRESLMRLLFQMDARNDYSGNSRDAFLAEYPVCQNQKDYFHRLCSAVSDHLDEIDFSLNKNTPRWSTDRMAKVDLAILRLAVGELLYMEDIPDSVAINEAVDLAKNFGTENSSKFVNGILGTIARQK